MPSADVKISSKSCKVGALANDASMRDLPVIDATKSPPAFQDAPQQLQQPRINSTHTVRQRSSVETVKPKRASRLQPSFIFTLVHRLVILAAAVLYLETCVAACLDAIHVLRGAENPIMNFPPYKTPLVKVFVGSTTLRASPLVQTVLNDDTTPRAGTIYLENGAASFESCTSVTLPDRTYGDAFQRSIHATVTSGAAYNLTFLDTSVSELIVPVVDCSASSVVWGDEAAVRFYYLTRMVQNHNDVHLLIVSMSVQEYMLPAEEEYGSAGVMTIVSINDLRAQAVTHHFVLALGYPFMQTPLEVFTLDGATPDSFWRLRSIPRDPVTDYSKLVLTSCRTGFYVSSENEQSNIRNTLWELSNDPITVISTWQWHGHPVLRDSWAWVHCVHLLLALDVFENLLVLLVVVYRNFRAGKIWIGDAFVTVSTTLWLRSSLVLLSWSISGFWSLSEFCLQTGNVLADTQGYFLYPAIIRADLLALFFCLIGLIGNVCKERIDPALTIGLFYVGFEGRVAITKIYTALYRKAVTYSVDEYSLAMSDVDVDSSAISPLRLWSPHRLPKHDAAFILAILVPIFSTFVLVIAYVAVRKLYRFFFPDRLLVQHITGVSEDEERLIQLKRNLTMFEIATGAALQNRFGVVADYNNCIYIRGIKYASADGIYSSGYLIANGKFLIQSDDLVTIWLMKILRKRFRNVYAYEVDGTTVKQQARLVYPETLTIADLLKLDVDNLA